MIHLKINGQYHSFTGDPEMPLLWCLREVLDLKGTKFGCGVGVCGICTVLIDGESNHACMVSMGQLAEREVVTIEGLVARNHPLLHAWVRHQVPQCGYCQSGQIMAAAALLEKYDQPSDVQIDKTMSSVLCRCGTYKRIRSALQSVANHSGEALPELQLTFPKTGDYESQQKVQLDEWISIAVDGRIIIAINHAEMGQGVVTGLAMLVAEELDVELARVQTVFAPAASIYKNPLFGAQTTGGSTSIRGEWERLRIVGAKARWRILQAAAQAWQVSPDECRTHKGTVYHDSSQRQIDYTELAVAAAKIKAPRRIQLKRPDEFQLLGHSQSRLEIPAMVTGQATYGTDIALPGMLYASVIRRPTSNAGLHALDATAAKAVDDVIDIVEIESGIAVLAKNSWAAIQGRQCLDVSWQVSNPSVQDNHSFQQQLYQAVSKKGVVKNRHGRADRLLNNSDDIIEATYETSFLAHATLEPMNCTAQVDDKSCHVWVGTQSQEGAKDIAARTSGLSRRKVFIHSTYLGGGFGRRLQVDYVADAVELAKLNNNPVQVLWSRADDMQHDFYRPAHVSTLKAVLDPQGYPAVWWQRSAGPGMALGMVEVPYKIANYQEEQVIVESPLPVGAWRAVAAGQSAFVVESFIDELAHRAEIDPLDYRLQLLEDAPRCRGVLELAAEKANWHSGTSKGTHQGIAHYFSFGSWVAHVAEVSVEEHQICVQRIVCAIDCGQTVNPDAIRAQMEGAIAMGLSAALKEQVLFEGRHVTQANFKEYPILTFSELPKIEVYIVPSKEPAGGVGEPGLPPVAPAVANAIYAATGYRLRKLPCRLP